MIKLKFYITIINLICICNVSQSQSPMFEWAYNIGDSGFDKGESITIDGANNVITTGSFEGTVDFDPGLGTNNLTSNGGTDLFVSKLDANGNFIWAIQIGGTTNDYGYSVTTDATNNVYVTGSFYNMVDFDPGAGVLNLFSSGSADAFILKLDPLGDLIWAKKIGGSTSGDVGYSVVVDVFLNVHVTGSYVGTVDFDPGPGTTNLTSSGFSDIFISKLDVNGDFVWAKGMGGALGNDIGRSIDIDALGNVYCTGSFSSPTSDFNPGIGTFNLSTVGGYDIFISKLDVNGDFVWAKGLGSTGTDDGRSIEIDISGNVYSTGYFTGTIDFDPGVGTSNLTSLGSDDIYILKLDANGDYQWAKRFGNISSARGRSIDSDNLGNVYSTGYFLGTVDFDPGVGVSNLSSTGGNNDVYISKLNNNGEYIWAISMGGLGGNHSRSLTVDPLNNIYTTGYFGGTSDFDPGVTTANFVSNGGNDMFIVKLNQCSPNSVSETIVACDTYTWPANSTTYTSSTTDVAVLTNVYGCDSTVTLNLTINNSNSGSETITACDTYTWLANSTTYTSSITDVVVLTNVDGCDSTVTLNLTINDSNTSTETVNACDTYTWAANSTTYTSSTTDVAVLTNVGGCDSTVTLNLTINNSNTSTETVNACDTYTWAANSTTYTSSTTDVAVLTNVDGCDSTVTLNLTVNNSNTSTETITACDTYTWSANGTTYTSSITDVAVLTNVDGCDSTVTLNLTVNNSNTSTETIIACDSYTWIDGNTYTANNNSATWVLTNAGGCDSTVTLDLSMSFSNTGTDVQTACDSYAWIDGNTYTASNSIATHTLTNVAGCDSVVTLNLSMSFSNTGTDVQTACESYTWIDGNTYIASNSIAIHTLTNVAGCDSVVTLNLSMSFSNTGTDVQTACDSYTWIDGNTYTANNSSATHTLTNVAGCDSIVTLNLTINTVNSSVTQVDALLTADESGATYMWLDCPAMTQINGATNQAYTATANGDYAVIVTINGCSDTSTCYTVTGVGIIENDFGSGLLLYPNPTDGDFSIDLGENYQLVTVTMTDLSGKVIQTKTYSNEHLLNLKIEEPAGVYLLVIESGDKKAVVRLVKE
ncbi:MAG: T9SS type A sorting domain-containing protein [Crocinitomicaceae bacterium]|nr:T9SS type A sorting domain-containing protein [Crocinitomicaceae bacterium]